MLNLTDKTRWMRKHIRPFMPIWFHANQTLYVLYNMSGVKMRQGRLFYKDIDITFIPIIGFSLEDSNEMESFGRVSDPKVKETDYDKSRN